MKTPSTTSTTIRPVFSMVVVLQNKIWYKNTYGISNEFHKLRFIGPGSTLLTFRLFSTRTPLDDTWNTRQGAGGVMNRPERAITPLIYGHKLLNI